MPVQACESYEFEGFRLTPSERTLARDGVPVPLSPKAFDLLLYFVQHSQTLLTKDELMSALWPDRFVEESNLTVAVSSLRKALGETPSRQFVQTVPKTGYRFVPDVILEPPSGEVTVAEPAPTIAPARSPATRRNPYVTGMALLLLLAAAVLMWRYHPSVKRSPSPAGTVSIAVLPFHALSPSSEDEYLELGIADSLIVRLTGLKGLSVKPMSAVARFERLESDAVASGRELQVTHVLDGKFQRVADRLQVSVRLLRISDGATLWSEKYDERFSDVFGVEDSISKQIARALPLQFNGDEGRRLTRHITENADAYEAYLKGRYFVGKRRPDAVRTGLGYFRDALRLDPDSALSYAGLADSLILLGSPGYSQLTPRTAIPEAEAAAQKALAIDPNLAEAHTSLAYAQLVYDWNWRQSEAEFKRAIELDPTYDSAHHWYSHYLVAMGRFDESLVESRRALDINPIDLSLNEHLAWHYMMARRYGDAITQCHRALELDPSFLLAHRVLGLSAMYNSDLQAAITEFRTAIELAAPDEVVLHGMLGRAYARAGQRQKALQMLRYMHHAAAKRYVSPIDIAQIYADLGDRDAAFRWMQQAFADRSPGLINLKVDPGFDRLRDDPRFDILVKQVGL